MVDFWIMSFFEPTNMTLSNAPYFGPQFDHFRAELDPRFWPFTVILAFFALKNLDFLEFLVQKIDFFQKSYFDLFYRSEP